MKLFRSLSIRNKLVLVSLLPLLALLFYVVNTVQDQLKDQKTAEKVRSYVTVAASLSKVLHELQKERALTFSFLEGKAAVRQELSVQREATDRALNESQKLLRQSPMGMLKYPVMDSLPVVRSRVDAQEQLVHDFFGEAKSEMVKQLSQLFYASENNGLRNQFEEYLLLLYTKDFLAQIRTELGAAISAGNFDDGAYGSFAALVGKYKVSEERFQIVISPELEKFVDVRLRSPYVVETESIIGSVFTNPSALTRQGYDRWWNASTNSINVFKDVEDFSMERIQKSAEDSYSAAQRKLWINLLSALVLIGFVILFIKSTVNGIVRAIAVIRTAAGKITKGDVNISLDFAGDSAEISNLADSFNEIVRVTKKYAEIAERIGNGDYATDISLRSGEDTLGMALISMRDKLRKLNQENQQRTWLLAGINQLNEKLRGEKDVKTLSQEIIMQICNYLDAKVGAIYIHENGRLNLVGSYAFTNRKNNANSFPIGEGLVGQAALEKKEIIFSDVPAGYLQIGSGLGNATPTNILIFPFIYENEVKGVLELGAAHRLSDVELEFLQSVSENLGIAFNTADSRTQMKELLEETQRQAEELEAQQEELKQSNEELHEKTELLERSEAELKTQQEELQQTNEELEEKANLLEEQKEKLENAKMDLENKARELEVTSKYKSEFLANMSHELRTPLNSILILSKLLTENKHKHLAEKEVEFASNIYNSGADLLNLINEILDLSKVEAGKMELDVSTVTVEEINSDLLSMFSEVAGNKSIEFSIICDEQDVSQLTTDRQRLQQILRNLLSNAFKFTPRGGKVTLRIGKPPKGSVFLNPRLNGQSQIVAFSVADSGIGIPVEKQGIIFEAFQQADGSTKRKYGGTGLGLSISRELANALGGELHVKSVESAGSTFTLFLPQYFEMAADAPAVKNNEVIRPAKTRMRAERLPAGDRPENTIDDSHYILQNDKVVLIMEDDIEFARILLDFVRERHYKGVIATQGNIGLSYARLYKPDAILLDMKLPVMDGAEVLRHLKNDPEMRHIPVQVISGFDRRKEGLELGAFDFIKKPVSRDDLQSAFDRIEAFANKKLKRLLVVEDNENQNKAIRELIGNGDVKSFPAFSGEQAYQMLVNDAFDCVIVDLGLPDMSGFELLEKIKANESLNKVPVVVYTGKDLSKSEHARLMKLANTVVLKTADSQERLLDETMLFLHRVESKLPKEKQNIIRKLHKTDEVLRNKHVLVVDDDIRNIYSLVNALDEEGMVCLTAENGKEAINKLRQHPEIDIVLMDIMMPEMDGYEATKEIRSMEKYKKLPVIALTAKAMKGDREKSLNAGMSDYISKPVDVEQLLSLMRVWLYK